MDWNRVCPGCMKEYPEGMNMEEACPSCGYSPASEDRQNALPAMSVLNGKYVAGRITEKNEREISYFAYDINLEMQIRIKEYFPSDLAKRGENKRTVEPATEDQREALDEGIKSYAAEAKKLVRQVTQDGVGNNIKEFFKENGTVYLVQTVAQPVEERVLTGNGLPQGQMPVNAAPAGVPAYNMGPVGGQMTEMPAAQNMPKKKKTGLFIGIGAGAAALLILVVVLVVTLGGKGGKRDEHTEYAAKTRTEVPEETGEPAYLAHMIGEYYPDEDVVMFATDNCLVFGHPDANGNLPDVTLLKKLAADQVINTVLVDGEYVYACVSDSGIWRTAINASEVAFEPVTGRDTFYFVLCGDYLVFTDGRCLYRTYKDGSGEVILDGDASDAYAVVNGWVYFYKRSDSSIRRVSLEGGEAEYVSDVDEVTTMQADASGRFLYVVTGGELYQVELDHGAYVDSFYIGKADPYDEIMVTDRYVFYLDPDGTWIHRFDRERRADVAYASGDQSFAFMALLNGRLYAVDAGGTYYCFDLENYEGIKLDFNYFDMD